MSFKIEFCTAYSRRIVCDSFIVLPIFISFLLIIITKLMYFLIVNFSSELTHYSSCQVALHWL